MQHEFEVQSTELLVDAPILAVRRDQVRMPKGSTAAREIVEHFGAVAVVAFDGARIAMIRQYRHAVGTRLWELPAGLLDVAQEDPLECAKRELQEEAGLAAQDWKLLIDVVLSPGFCDETVRVYLAQSLSEVPRPEAGDDEEADLTFEWLALEGAVEMVLSQQVHNSTAVAGILTAWQVLKGGAQAQDADQPFELRPQALAARRQAEGFIGDMKKVSRGR
ncbi:NUDIX hydrolase [Corynebacterium sp. 153RC1]|uniref:NUDIX domain-containing protein n=1 Tax=unclassified Corynebacterium TaxID=2624378 RepID=UPI00211C5E6A|nr:MULTISPECIES: NUDIX hydrolase [unclassified Corynebacterium]MCQ9353405.1 NUDIX hydrolase [Corynebacterium sp. 209RC1]MCQ9355627.1 NUDIX hydrolase [Corynebacterium sp. 1222RC1]MCQ9357809.1 NUDIX hydrolase [Corynebacterium sp. 122RC1]MCQ9360004.1 NUDIX hydrolase [Corynebacterium sp. 142RC1]MCQ9362148.1 NUDIX hydrolase [Corynebacterium sp. 153RC1]